ncbi:MAG TPA: LysR substrate-binding domain-containing protein, partial [Bacillota bacterium]|nr:LysR substrate-binding domain-containing protein [Bacillota bacterium]
RLLVGSHPAFWDDLLATLRRLGALGRTMPVTDMDITRRFIGEGLGVSFLPASAVAADLGSGRLAAVPTPGLEAPSSEVYAVRAAPPRRGAGLAEGPASPEGVEALLAALRGDRGPG